MEENGNVQQEMKFCSECGQKVLKKAIICPHCGCQIGTPREERVAPIVINNTNQNSNTNNNISTHVPGTKLKDKWISFFLCLFLGWIGAHKFYEEKFGAGILYAVTFGLFGFGWVFNTLALLGKPNPYYVY